VRPPVCPRAPRPLGRRTAVPAAAARPPRRVRRRAGVQVQVVRPVGPAPPGPVEWARRRQVGVIRVHAGPGSGPGQLNAHAGRDEVTRSSSGEPPAPLESSGYPGPASESGGPGTASCIRLGRHRALIRIERRACRSPSPSRRLSSESNRRVFPAVSRTVDSGGPRPTDSDPGAATVTAASDSGGIPPVAQPARGAAAVGPGCPLSAAPSRRAPAAESTPRSARP
jgi:hypothetical protein